MHDRAPARLLDTSAPFIGRDEEFEMLAAAFADIRHSMTGQTIVIVGEPGAGKSRLVDEFVRSQQGVRPITTRCPSYGEDLALTPVADLVLDAVAASWGDDSDDVFRLVDASLANRPDGAAAARALGALFGQGGVGLAAEIPWGLRMLITTVAAERPVIAIVEDAHFGSAAVQDVLTAMTARPVHGCLLLITQRRDDRLEGLLRNAGAKTIRLDPLDREASSALLSSFLGSTENGPALQRLVDRTGGNPLFLEEIGRVVARAGSLDLDEAQDVPASLTSLISERLDQLGQDERVVAEHASVIGEEFAQPHVAHLLDGQHKFEESLSTLVTEQVLDELDAAHYRFHHALVRDEAYRRIAKVVRARLHERYAEYLEREFGDSTPEIVGLHLELAFRLRADLRPPNSGDRILGRRAAERLLVAAINAKRRDDAGAVVGFLRRVLQLVDETNPMALLARWRLGEALVMTGALEEAGSVQIEVRGLGKRLGDEGLMLRTSFSLLHISFLRGERGLRTVTSQLERLVEKAEARGDEELLVLLWQMLADVHFADFRFDQVMRFAEQAASYDARTGARAGELLKWFRLFVGCFDMTPVDTFEAEAREVLDDPTSTLSDRSGGYRALGMCRAWRGDAEGADTAFQACAAIFDQLGARFQIRALAHVRALAEMLTGKVNAAERTLREVDSELQLEGERMLRASIQVSLARVSYQLGRRAEAKACLDLVATFADPDDIHVQVESLGVAARLASDEGDVGEALKLARGAGEIAETTRHALIRAQAHIDLAYTLAATGMEEEAGVERRRARSVLAQKNVFISETATDVVTTG